MVSFCLSLSDWHFRSFLAEVLDASRITFLGIPDVSMPVLTHTDWCSQYQNSPKIFATNRELRDCWYQCWENYLILGVTPDISAFNLKDGHRIWLAVWRPSSPTFVGQISVIEINFISIIEGKKLTYAKTTSFPFRWSKLKKNKFSLFVHYSLNVSSLLA